MNQSRMNITVWVTLAAMLTLLTCAVLVARADAPQPPPTVQFYLPVVLKDSPDVFPCVGNPICQNWLAEADDERN